MGEVFPREQAKASDAKLVELQHALHRADAAVAREVEYLHHKAGDSQKGWGQDRRWQMSAQDAYDKVREIADSGEYAHTRETALRALESYAAKAAVAKLAAKAGIEQSKEWQKDGQWDRCRAGPAA